MRGLALLLLVPLACTLDEQGLVDDGGADIAVTDVSGDVAVDGNENEAGLDQLAAEASDVDSVSPFSPAQLAGLVLWLRADLGVQLDAQNRVQSWTDQSTHAIVAAQASAASRPQYAVHTINGQPTVTFVAADQDLLALSSFPSLGAAHAFVVQQRTASTPPTATTAGFWMLTGNVGNGACVPYSDGVVYDDFGASFRHTAVAPPIGMATPNVYEVVSTATDWMLRENGATFFDVATNSVSFARSPYLLGGDMPGGNYYDGDWAELAIFDHELTSTDRSLLIAYFNGRYSLGAN